MSLSVLSHTYKMRHGLCLHIRYIMCRQLMSKTPGTFLLRNNVDQECMFVKNVERYNHNYVSFSTPFRSVSTSYPKFSQTCAGNEPSEPPETCVPPPKSFTTLWAAERAAALALLFLLPLDFIFPVEPLEMVVAILSVMHNHWGMEGVVGDYVRPNLFGRIIPKIGHYTVYAFSALVLAGLVDLILNGEGLADAIKKFWAVKPKPAEPKEPEEPKEPKEAKPPAE